MDSIRRRHLLASAGALLAPTALFAQAGWPNKAVRIVVPFAPEGTTDILARALAPELGAAWARPSSSTTSRSPAATSAPTRSPRRCPMATRC